MDEKNPDTELILEPGDIVTVRTGAGFVYPHATVERVGHAFLTFRDRKTRDIRSVQWNFIVELVKEEPR